MKRISNCMNIILLVLMTMLVVMSSVSVAAADEIVVYSARKEHLVKPLFDAYFLKTGIKIKYITNKAAPLLARLQAEGISTSADLLIMADAGNLQLAAQKGMLLPVKSAILEKNIPLQFRDPKGRWFGLSVRALAIVYATDRVKASELSTYEDLADPRWKGRLCLRTSKKVYNQTLVAMMIAQNGEKITGDIIRGWVNNLASAPFSNDNRAMKAIAGGQCDVGIVNTDYYGRLLKKEPGYKLALFWPNQNDRGVHVNLSGAAVTSNASNRPGAIKLLEWLSSRQAQKIITSLNMEYPANPLAKTDATLSAWGKFMQDQLNVTKTVELQEKSVMLMDQAGYK